MPENQLHDHMRRVKADVLADYERIRKRVREDPGTAGDEGEETWAEVLRAWLPATYQVETKGRVMFVDGWSSPQVDVVVLKPWYPRGLARRAWKFEDRPNTAVFSTRPVTHGDAPILVVAHDADGSWQFMPGEPVDGAQATVVGLREIVRRDDSLTELARLPRGWRAVRDREEAPWRWSRQAPPGL